MDHHGTECDPSNCQRETPGTILLSCLRLVWLIVWLVIDMPKGRHDVMRWAAEKGYRVRRISGRKDKESLGPGGAGLVVIIWTSTLMRSGTAIFHFLGQ